MPLLDEAEGVDPGKGGWGVGRFVHGVKSGRDGRFGLVSTFGFESIDWAAG